MRAFLEAAAIAGDPFDLDVATAVAGLEEADALDALDALLTAGAVAPTEAPRRFAFAGSDRDAVYAGIDVARRRAGHAAALARLADAPVVARAPHALHCGDVAVLSEAGFSCMFSAPEDAAMWLAAALDGGGPASALLPGLGLAQASGGRLAEAAATLEQALPVAGPGRPQVLVALTGVDQMRGAHHAARERLEAEAPGPDRETLLATCALYAGDFAEGRDHARTTTGPLALALDALLTFEAGDFEDALPRLDAAARAVDATPDAELFFRHEALDYLGWAEHWTERHGDAIRHFDRGIAFARSGGMPLLLVPMLIGRCFALAQTGRLAEAGADAEAAATVARRLRSRSFMAWSEVATALVALLAGDTETGLAHATAGYEGARSAEVNILRAGAAWVLANAWAATGREGVTALLEEGAGGPGLPLMEPAIAVQTYALIARAERSRAALEEAAARAEAIELPGASATVDFARAEIDADVEAARSARAGFVTAGWPIHAARALALEARLAGDDDLARRAAAELEAHKATPALTPRQQEIAALAAAGRTNDEIAAQLGISARTVEGHLGRIYTALGVSGRAALAALTARR